MRDPIAEYLGELERRLKRHIHADKVAELLTETEAHLRACAEEHGEQGAMSRFGSVQKYAQSLLKEHKPEQQCRLPLLLVLATGPLLVLAHFLLPSSPIGALLELALLVNAVVSVSKIRTPMPVRVLMSGALSISLGALLSGALYIHPVHNESIRRIDLEDYRRAAFPNADIALAFQRQNERIDSARVITAIGTGQYGAYVPIYTTFGSVADARLLWREINHTTTTEAQWWIDHCGGYQNLRSEQLPTVGQSAWDGLVSAWSTLLTPYSLLALFVFHQAVVAWQQRRPRQRKLA